MAAALTGCYATADTETQSREKKSRICCAPLASFSLCVSVSAVANHASSFSITLP